MKPNFDFAKSNEVSYEDQRSRVGAGDCYGIGEPPKQGKMRSSYMSAEPSAKKMKPPMKVG